MSVREANLKDAEALARVTVLTWQQAYRGLLPQEYLDTLDIAGNQRSWERRLGQDEQPTGTLVFEQEPEGVIGFIHVSPSRDADAASAAEVTAIYVLPDHSGRGRGRALMDAGLCRLAEAGYGQVTLWVLDNNAPARRFYEAAGWRPDGAVKTDHSRGFPIVEVRYRIAPTRSPIQNVYPHTR